MPARPGSPDGGLNDGAGYLEGNLFDRSPRATAIIARAASAAWTRDGGTAWRAERHAGTSRAMCQTGEDFGVKLER